MRTTAIDALRQDLELLLAGRDLLSWQAVLRTAVGALTAVLVLLPWL